MVWHIKRAYLTSAILGLLASNLVTCRVTYQVGAGLGMAAICNISPWCSCWRLVWLKYSGEGRKLTGYDIRTVRVHCCCFHWLAFFCRYINPILSCMSCCCLFLSFVNLTSMSRCWLQYQPTTMTDPKDIVPCDDHWSPFRLFSFALIIECDHHPRSSLILPCSCSCCLWVSPPLSWPWSM